MLNTGLMRALDSVLPGSLNLAMRAGAFIRRRKATPEGSVASAVDADAEIMARADSILSEAIELGRAGQFTVVPSYFAVSATDNCNLECIMCPGHSGMTGPALTLTQAENIFASLNSNSANFGSPVYLDVTAGEATVNRELHLIFKMFKERFPQATISIITNATFPLKGRIREIFEYADDIAISIDGATKETYERIRRRSRFENVIRNAKEIAELKGGKVSVIFVAMDQNMHEVPDMVRLCSDIGAKNLVLQAVEHRKTPFLREGDDISLDMPADQIKRYFDTARELAAELGIGFNPTPGTAALAQPVVSDEPLENSSPDERRNAIRMCNIPWTSSPRMNFDGDEVVAKTPCCHMVELTDQTNLYASGEFKGRTMNAIFNSERYWEIRKDLLSGKLADGACRECQYFNSYQWTPKRLREIEAGLETARKRSREG